MECEKLVEIDSIGKILMRNIRVAP